MNVHRDALCLMVKTWARHEHRNSIEQWLAVGGRWRLVAVGGGWRLVAVGSWQLVAVGGWRLGISGPWGLSLSAVPNKKKLEFLRTTLVMKRSFPPKDSSPAGH